MGFFGIVGSVIFAFSFIFHMATRKEVESDYQAGRASTPRLLKFKRITGQTMAIGAFLILFSIATTENNETKNNEVVAENEDKIEENIDYYEMARTAKDLHTLRKAFQEIEPDVLDVRFKNDIVIIEYDPEAGFWDETSLMKDFANSSTKLMAAMDGSMHYKSFAFERKGNLIDDKGNEETKGMIRVLYFEGTIRTINFDNYPDVVSLNPYKFYTNASGYGVYGALYMNTKSEIRSNMPGFKDPETDRYDVYAF